MATTFANVLMVAVVIDGEPSYTSGAQKWKGAAAILNNIPIIINTIPIGNQTGIPAPEDKSLISATLK